MRTTWPLPCLAETIAAFLDKCSSPMDNPLGFEMEKTSLCNRSLIQQRIQVFALVAFMDWKELIF